MKIKAYIRCDEYTNTHYFKWFNIIDELPKEGESYNAEDITEVDEVSLDHEQGNDNVYNFNYYRIKTFDDHEYWVAVEKPEIITYLKNNHDKEICFDNIEQAKKYYIPTAESRAEILNEENFIGDDYKLFVEEFEDYILELESSDTLEELAETLNVFKDKFGDGSEFIIKYM